MSKIVTVLGASGNIGKILIPYLASKGYTVKAVGRNKPNFNDPNIINLVVNYDDQNQLTEACKDSQAVYMLIGLEYKATIWQDQWPALTSRIIQACKETKSKLIFFDNVYSYGLIEGKMTENSELNPETKKGKVRKEMVEMLLKSINSGEINGVIAKSADFYGPGITTSVIGDRFFDLIINKNTVEIFGNPQKIHNYTFINDIPEALEKLANSDFNGNIHLPTANAWTGNQYKELLEKLTGKNLKLTNLSQNMAWWIGIFMPVLRELHEMMYQSENDYNFDSSKIMSMFPDLKVTPYEQGFQETLAWYKEKLAKK